jgi:hypothetical protein
MGKANLTPAQAAATPSPWRLFWALGLVALLQSATWAQSPTAGEDQIKAAFLYNFAKFVEWAPSAFRDAAAPLQICVFGRDPVGEELRNITHEKQVNGRKIEVRKLADFEQAKTCHILFIASSEKTQIKPILESLRGTSVLTVGDTNAFAAQGGMINFVLENDRVQFEVNRKSADQAGLKISSKLLSVAKSVDGVGIN